jgi:predicted transposase/invertase (TIGR01784 family)
MTKIMERKRLDPLNDYLFMKCMSEEGDEEQLIAFLNAVLHRKGRSKIMSITILERMISADIVGGKFSVLDTLAKMNDGSTVNIEVQLHNVSNLDRRSLFYWSRKYVKGIKFGEDYDKQPNVITINILKVEFLTLEEFHTSFHWREDCQKDYCLTDAMEIHFIDMIKFRRLKEKNIVDNVLHRWLSFFDKQTSDETIQEIISIDSAIKKVREKIQVVAQNDAMLHEYEIREKSGIIGKSAEE